MWFLSHERYARAVSCLTGNRSVSYRVTRAFIVHPSVLLVFRGRSSNLRSCRQADVLVGNSCLVPMVRDLRFPPIHCRNRHVPRPLSNRTLPVLCRTLILVLPSLECTAAMLSTG